MDSNQLTDIFAEPDGDETNSTSEFQGRLEDHPDAPKLDVLRRYYRQARDASFEARQLATRCSDYFHGKQLSPQILALLNKRRQPPSWDNKIRPAVNGVLGLLDSGETDPEAIGRNEDDDEAATVVTKILRYFADVNDFDDVKRDASFDLLVKGIGATIVETKEKGYARVTHVPYREFFHDPLSVKHDFRDARYLGRAKWIDADDVERMFPEAYSGIGNPFAGTFCGDGPEDEPEYKELWLDPSRRRVLVVELYYRDKADGVWKHATYCHAGLLDFGPSPYVDDDRQPICPIVACSYEVDDNGDRYSMVKDMLPLQDDINARTSKMLHITNSAQVEMQEGANPTQVETARQEAARPDGVMPINFKKLSQVDVFQGNAEMLAKATASIERMAPSPALLGRAGGANESGRARQVLQQAGLSELQRAFNRWSHWELRCYRQMWFVAQQYLTDKDMIRITAQNGAREALHINVPVVEHRLQPVMDPSTGQPAIDPMTGQPHMQYQPVVLEVKNELAQMDMDITVKTVRQVDTLRQESFDKILEYGAKTGISPISPAFEMLIQFADIPGKEELLAKYHDIKGRADEQAQQAQQAQQQQAQQVQAINAAATQSKIERDHAQAERDHAMALKHLQEMYGEQWDLEFKKYLASIGQAPMA